MVGLEPKWSVLEEDQGRKVARARWDRWDRWDGPDCSEAQSGFFEEMTCDSVSFLAGYAQGAASYVYISMGKIDMMPMGLQGASVTLSAGLASWPLGIVLPLEK